MIVPAFLPREKPISRKAKPACMKNTNRPATITQMVLMPTLCSSPWFPARSYRSADAVAGMMSAASVPNTSARTARERLM